MSLIPKNFHFIFGLRKQTEPFSIAYYICLESCWQLNRPEKIFFYYHHEPYGPYWDAIRPRLTLEQVSLNPFVEAYHYSESTLSPFRYAHHSDFVRLEKLVERGGVYADIDTLFLNPIPKTLFEKSFVIGCEGFIPDPKTGDSVRSLCNAFMMCEPFAEFGRLWLERMAINFDGSWSNHSTLLPQRLAEEFPDLIHIEPEKSFYCFAATLAGLATLFEARVQIPEGVYSVHLWEHLWWNTDRTDFSDFSGAALTEKYVRQAETTYAVEARRYLPPNSISDEETTLRNRVAQKFRSALRKLFAETRSLISIAFYPWLKRFRPELGKRLAMARGYRAYQMGKRRFSLRNPLEIAKMRGIVEFDEYHIFENGFCADDGIVDLGAKIGIFSYASHWLGSRRISAFEWNEADFGVAHSNLSDLDGVSLKRVRVPLDEILTSMRHVKLLRLGDDADVWKELLACRHLKLVERIVGEIPSVDEPEGLRRCLESQGFAVRVECRSEDFFIEARRSSI